MKVFFSEYLTDYSTYTFGYAVYCQISAEDDISQVYACGFLPYTGDVSLAKTTFYLARSLRIDLERFENSSENRRVSRKVEPLGISMKAVKVEDFDLEDSHFLDFCSRYAAQRFSTGPMASVRFRYILSRNLITHIFVFESKEKCYGYVLACKHADMLHYWYAFFDTAYLKSHALGKWIMWKTICWAKAQAPLKHIYLGTCYLPKSLYKVRDHKGAAFFDGTGWNTDTKILKKLCQRDAAQADIKSNIQTDIFKSEIPEISHIFRSL